MHDKPRILFSTPVLKHPAVGGPYLRIENSIKALSQISDLTIYCRTTITEPEIAYYRKFCQNFYCEPKIGSLSRQKGKIQRLINRFSLSIFDHEIFPKTENFQDLLRVANEVKPDIIWLGFGNISYPLLRYIKQNSQYKVVCDTDSVWSRFILRGLPFAKNDTEKRRIEREGREKEREELWGTRLADVTTAVSAIDAGYYRELMKNPERIHIFSNVIDVTSYRSPGKKPEYFKNPCIYLAGTFWPASPMEEAARWIIAKILPILKKEIPDIHCYIIGNGSDKILNDVCDSNITITGQLPSVLPYLIHADAVVVPLKFESGTRFKILEAGACGIPVVSTTLGAEGIPVTHGIDVLIADEPEAFANAVTQLLANPGFAQQMGANLKSLIEKNYDIPCLVKEGESIISFLMRSTEK
jgi:polysaccharide biosynthesis protein PslH